MSDDPRYLAAVRKYPRRKGEGALAYVQRIDRIISGSAASDELVQDMPTITPAYREPGEDEE